MIKRKIIIKNRIDLFRGMKRGQKSESSKTKMFALPKFTENVVASPQFLFTILFLNSLPFLFFLHDHFIPSGSAGGSPLLLSKANPLSCVSSLPNPLLHQLCSDNL